MMSLERINFFESDRHIDRLDKVAEKVADFLFNNRNRMLSFTDLMRISSSWDKKNYTNNLQRWGASVRGRKKVKVPDTEAFIAVVNEFFNVCENNQELKKIRGLVPEKLIEMIMNKRHNDKICKIEFGKGVEIDSERVIYECSNPYTTAEDSDRNRQSVDAGFWDGKLGEFIEVKFNPEAFHTKDINYLRKLNSKLKDSDIEHKLYLVSFGEKTLTQKKLESLEKWIVDEFVIIGKEELFNLENVLC